MILGLTQETQTVLDCHGFGSEESLYYSSMLLLWGRYTESGRLVSLDTIR